MVCLPCWFRSYVLRPPVFTRLSSLIFHLPITQNFEVLVSPFSRRFWQVQPTPPPPPPLFYSHNFFHCLFLSTVCFLLFFLFFASPQPLHHLAAWIYKTTVLAPLHFRSHCTFLSPLVIFRAHHMIDLELDDFPLPSLALLFFFFFLWTVPPLLLKWSLIKWTVPQSFWSRCSPPLPQSTFH